FFQGWGGTSVAVSGNYAFLSGANKQGFYIVDVSDPAMPKEVFHSTGKEVYDIAISGNDVYLARADGTTIFELLDVSNPYAPKIADTFSITDTADRSAIAIMNDYIYAASGETWHIFRKPDTIPPQVTIEKPGQGEVLTNQTITVSGTAFDKSGLLEVRVNGKFAGTEVWAQVIALVEGTNNINITASDKKGNNITERLRVIYRPSVEPNISMPAQTITAAPTAAGADGIKIIKNPVFYIVVFVILAVLIYRFWLRKMKR
ncbi:MAG: Ig-like domain-containing protein, partial [Candidatus Methanoperedens sp.]|nr:Ig-like domain-containing protein [Candidatus Methanoperedens sp.]